MAPGAFDLDAFFLDRGEVNLVADSAMCADNLHNMFIINRLALPSYYMFHAIWINFNRTQRVNKPYLFV